MEWSNPNLIDLRSEGLDKQRKCSNGNVAKMNCNGGGTKGYVVCHGGGEIQWELCAGGGGDII